MKFIKVLFDNIVLVVILWLSIPVTFWVGSFLPLDAPDSLLILGLLGLYVTNASVLMWLWYNFTPIRNSGEKKTGIIKWLVNIYSFFAAFYISAALALLEMNYVFAMVSESWRLPVALLLVLIQGFALMSFWNRWMSGRRHKETKLDEY